MPGALRADGTHEPLKLGELIRDLQAVEVALGPDGEVFTVDGVGDSRQMWSAYSGEGFCELFLSVEPGY